MNSSFRRALFSAITLAGSLAFSIATHAQSILVNGSFENGATANGNYQYQPTDQSPWVFSTTAGVLTQNSSMNPDNQVIPDGRIAAFIKGSGTLSQTFSVTTAGFYQLSLWIVNGWNSCGQSFTISIDGNVVFSKLTSGVWPQPNSYANDYIPPFSLTSGSHTLLISGTPQPASAGTCPAAIDKVQLVAVADPDSSYRTTFLNSFLDNGSAPGALKAQTGGQYQYLDAGTPWFFTNGGITQQSFLNSFLPSNSLVFDPDVQAMIPVRAGARTDGVNPYLNNQSGFARTNGSMSQTWINSSAGSYQISIAAAQTQIEGAPTATVSIDGTSIGSFLVTTPAYTPSPVTVVNNGYVNNNFLYYSTVPTTISAGQHTITISTANASLLVDGVWLVPYTANQGPGSFNAFESAYSSGSFQGYIKTKIAGQSFSIDVVAIETTGKAIRTDFTGTVNVELIDASNTSGSATGTNCKTSYTPLAGRSPISLSFTSADWGRKTISITESNAWKNVRVRVTRTDASPSAISCSMDAFAIRPSAFDTIVISDADDSTPGVTRLLNNTGLSGGVVHRAGKPLLIQSNALSATNTLTTGYTSFVSSPVITACGTSACPTSVSTGTWVANENGTFTVSSPTPIRFGSGSDWYIKTFTGTNTCNSAAFGGDPHMGIAKTCQIPYDQMVVASPFSSGTLNSSAYYNGVGAFNMQLMDTTFADIDRFDGSTTTDRNIASPVLTVGRFVPDHYDLVAVLAPTFKTFGASCASTRSFTYMGQAFGYSIAPTGTITAKDANGSILKNYANAFWKISSSNLSETFSSYVGGATFDATGSIVPALVANNDGTGKLTGNSTSSFRFTRPAAPVAPFNANLALAWGIADNTEVGVTGNGSITGTPLTYSNIAFDSGVVFRYGVLTLTPSYGSELVNLPVLVQAKYWDGVIMATNTFDECTSIPATAVALGNYQSNLSTCAASTGAAATTLVDGRGYITFSRPGAGKNGSVDATLLLAGTGGGQACTAVGSPTTPVAAGLVHLQGKWGAATGYNVNPAARISFGQYKTPLIYLQNVY